MQDISSFIHQLDKYMEAHHGESRMKIEENKYNDTEIFPKPVNLRYLIYFRKYQPKSKEFIWI